MEEAIKKFFTNYFNFNDRTTRKDYWFTILDMVIIGIALGIISGILGDKIGSALVGLFELAVFIPSLAQSVRRLHDTNKSGWMLLLSLIPLVGAIILLIFYCQPSVTENNKYGKQL